MIYRSEAAAVARIEALKAVGVWPGYYRVPGGFRLTYDPEGPLSRSGQEGEVLT